MRILVVEDESVIRDLISINLSLVLYEVFTVEYGLEAKVNDKEVYLTSKEYDLLILFLQNKNMALFREPILDRVWGFEYGGETRTVDRYVQQIREKLDLKNSIKTIFKVGYRLEK